MPSLLLTLIGLILATIGAVVIAFPIATLSKTDITVIRLHSGGMTLERALLKQRRFAAWGIPLVVLGAGIQTVGALV